MKRKLLFLFPLFVFLQFAFTGESPRIYYLHLSWEEVTHCNGIFVKTADDYWHKDWFFGRDSVNNCGIIQFSQSAKTCIPLILPVNAKRKKGTAWKEKFGNDTLKITISGEPIPQMIQHKFSYDVAFELISRRDTIREKLIGHCNY